MKLLILRVCASINICLLCLPFESFCADRQYEECNKLRSCGNQTIRFPFYTEKISENCGYPGFELTCLNNEVLSLDISGNHLRITEVFYANNSFRVSNLLISRRSACRLSKIRNLSLPSDDRFQLLTTSYLLLLSNCTPNSEQMFSKYKLNCGQTEIDADWVLAMKTNDINLSNATEACQSLVVAPVREYTEDDDDTDYLKLIRNGFDLKWIAPNCSDCEASGGYCGYEGEPDNKFTCFCSDRPHSDSCGKSLYHPALA
ncbi:LEAF RUST 10 DISEASE-RESISTANCE LOCUS RECEPTOR-LIKE PROTEIN KINASE-like 1.2 [Apium graveolens]|uniref:LEAF RUST 10 DISEASE-RESISTANCE LOCUS RECEPTOR-LIKE PROTEIN KINASE-like 1.2 n=1 Tax=Apium graveolens TaxID=4045 RepID=UPI003D7BF763